MADYLVAVKSGFGGLCGIEGQSVLAVSVLVAASRGVGSGSSLLRAAGELSGFRFRDGSCGLARLEASIWNTG